MYPLIFQPYHKFSSNYNSLYGLHKTKNGEVIINNQKVKMSLIQEIKSINANLNEFLCIDRNDFLLKLKKYKEIKEDLFNNYGFSKILEYCKAYYGERNVDFDIDSYTQRGTQDAPLYMATKASICIYFENLHIVSEDGPELDIKDFYFIIKYNCRSSRILDFICFRTSFENNQRLIDNRSHFYIHSHIGISTYEEASHNFESRIRSFCTGEGLTIATAIRTENYLDSSSDLKFEGFVINIIDLLSWESISGTPYIKISSLSSIPNTEIQIVDRTLRGSSLVFQSVVSKFRDGLYIYISDNDDDFNEDYVDRSLAIENLFRNIFDCNLFKNYNTISNSFLELIEVKYFGNKLEVSIDNLLTTLFSIFNNLWSVRLDDEIFELNIVELDLDLQDLSFFDFDKLYCNLQFISFFDYIIEFKSSESGDIITPTEYFNLPNDYRPLREDGLDYEVLDSNILNPILNFKNENKYLKAQKEQKSAKSEKSKYYPQIREQTRNFWKSELSNWLSENETAVKAKTFYTIKEEIHSGNIRRVREIIPRTMSY